MLDSGIIILAGGKNSRMKQDKAFLVYNEKPLIEEIVAKAQGYFQEIIVVTNKPKAHEYLGVGIAVDIFPGQGPLAGIHAGLLKAASEYNLVIACDMPFISMELGKLMLGRAHGYDAVVPVTEDGYQPLHSVYSKTCIPVIEEYLQKKLRRTTAIYDRLKILEIDTQQLKDWGISPQVFLNVNTPQELKKVRTEMKERK